MESWLAEQSIVFSALSSTSFPKYITFFIAYIIDFIESVQFVKKQPSVKIGDFLPLWISSDRECRKAQLVFQFLCCESEGFVPSIIYNLTGNKFSKFYRGLQQYYLWTFCCMGIFTDGKKRNKKLSLFVTASIFKLSFVQNTNLIFFCRCFCRLFPFCTEGFLDFTWWADIIKKCLFRSFSSCSNWSFSDKSGWVPPIKTSKANWLFAQYFS